MPSPEKLPNSLEITEMHRHCSSLLLDKENTGPSLEVIIRKPTQWPKKGFQLWSNIVMVWTLRGYGHIVWVGGQDGMASWMAMCVGEIWSSHWWLLLFTGMKPVWVVWKRLHLAWVRLGTSTFLQGGIFKGSTSSTGWKLRPVQPQRIKSAEQKLSVEKGISMPPQWEEKENWKKK